jgi:hypothetical protein
MREKTILQGLGYMMGFGVPVSERNADISSTIRRARLYPTSYMALVRFADYTSKWIRIAPQRAHRPVARSECVYE